MASGPKAYVRGTCDTKGDAPVYVRQLIAAAGVPRRRSISGPERWPPC